MTSHTEAADLPPKQEIKITSAMLEAGVTLLWESGAVENPISADRMLVAEIYTAMALVSADCSS